MEVNAQEATVVNNNFAAPPVHVPDYLVWSILATLFCCMPIGVASVVFAARANGKKASGDYEGALQDVKKAKLWLFISIGAYFAYMFIIGMVYLIFFLVNIAAVAAENMN